MKYLSLIKVMKKYNEQVKENGFMYTVSYNSLLNRFSAMADYAPFTILRSWAEPETGQQLKTLEFMVPFTQTANLTVRPGVSMCLMAMPPVLEVAWLKQALDLPKETEETLEQLSYRLILWISKFMFYQNNLSAWEEVIKEEFSVEVDDLNETATVLRKIWYPRIRIPGNRGWMIYLWPADSFKTLFGLCKDSQFHLKYIYLYLPLLLTIFMVDDTVDERMTKRLASWSSDARIRVENDLNEYINRLEGNLHVQRFSRLTYGNCHVVTGADVDFLKSILTIIRDRLHDVNSNFGTVTYQSYQCIPGPSTVRASVLLTHMDILWENEMERVRREEAERNGSDHNMGA